MNLQRFIVILVLVVVMGLTLAYEHARIIHAGYVMSRLSRERERLTERQRTLAVELAELKRPERIVQEVRRWKLELVPLRETGRVLASEHVRGWRTARGY